MGARFWGLFLAILGIFIVIVTVPRFTGLAVFEDASFARPVQIIGFLLFIGGILLFMTQRKDLESHVDVYDDGIGKGLKDREREHYFMNDSELAVSQNGKVSLGEFTRQINSYRGQKDSEEYIEVIRTVYGPGLHDIVAQGGEKAKVARAFLDVLEGPEEKQDDDSISPEEKREMKMAFRGWDGTPSREQMEVCRRYGITYEHGPNQGKFRLGSYSVTVSLTPSREAGNYITSDIANMIEKNRKEGKKKKAS